MQMILKYLGQYQEFEIVIITEEVVKNQPIEVTTIFKTQLYLELANMQDIDCILLERIPAWKVHWICQKI